LLENPVVILNK